MHNKHAILQQRMCAIYFKAKREQPLPVQRGENKMLNFRKDKLCKLGY